MIGIIQDFGWPFHWGQTRSSSFKSELDPQVLLSGYEMAVLFSDLHKFCACAIEVAYGTIHMDKFFHI